MSDYTVKSVESKVVREHSVKNTYTVDVVIKVSSRLCMISITKIPLSGMTERCVSNVVAKSDSLNKIKIQVECVADRTRYTRNQLNVKSTSRYIVIFKEGENLCLISIAIVVRTMDDFINIANKSCTNDIGFILVAITANYICVVKCKLPFLYRSLFAQKFHLITSHNSAQYHLV